MPEPTYNWDFFLSHAGADTDSADQLYVLLAGQSAVFLDARCLELGDDWDTRLATALSKARVIVVLVSARTDQAYYEGEEIATAIQLVRQNSGQQRVVPLYLDDQCPTPFGLHRKHSLYLTKAGSLRAVADRLLGLLAKIRAGELKQVEIIESHEIALAKISTGSAKEKLSGYKEVTWMFRSLVPVLCVMLVILLVLMAGVLITDKFKDTQLLALSVFGGLFAAILFSLMIIVYKSINIAIETVRRQPSEG